MLFLVFFIVVALLVALKGNKKFILFFMVFYPVLPDYFAIELGGGLPLLKASRILLLILMLCVCFHNKKIHLIRQPLKVTGLYWPLFIYFAARILANGYYAPSLSAAINTEFTVIVEQLLLIECGKMLEKGGYVIKSLNTINFRKSMHYNPFSYIRSEKDILKLVNTIIVNTKGDGDKSGEDFWVSVTRSLTVKSRRTSNGYPLLG